MSGGIPRAPGAGQVKCWRIPPGKRAKLVVISPRLELWPYHGAHGRNLLCPGALGRRCRLCEQNKPPRLERWAEARLEETQRRVIASFTQGAVANCPPLLHRVNDSRGLVVVLSRLGGTTGGVMAEVVAVRTKRTEGLPDPICEVRQKILALYSVDESNLAGTLKLLPEAESKTLPIPNVAQSAAAPPALKLAVGCEGFSRIDWSAVNAHNERCRVERGIGDTSAPDVDARSFLRLIPRDSGPDGPSRGGADQAGDDQADGIVFQEPESLRDNPPESPAPPGEQPSGAAAPGGGAGPAPQADSPGALENATHPADAGRVLTAAELRERLSQARKRLPPPRPGQR